MEVIQISFNVRLICRILGGCFFFEYDVVVELGFVVEMFCEMVCDLKGIRGGINYRIFVGIFFILIIEKILLL